MGADNRFDGNINLKSLKLDEAADENLLAVVSSLIDQNSQLEQKLQELDSRKGLADGIVEEAHEQAKEIRQRAEKEAQDRAAAIISEAETKAKLEAERIIAEANQKVEDIVKDKVQSAIYQGSIIIDKAQEQSLAMLEAARSQADAISNRTNKKVKR